MKRELAHNQLHHYVDGVRVAVDVTKNGGTIVLKVNEFYQIPLTVENAAKLQIKLQKCIGFLKSGCGVVK